MKKRGQQVGATHGKDGTPYKRKGPKPGQARKLFLTVQPGLVRRMHKDHLAGLCLAHLQQKYGYTDANIKRAFERLGLRVIIDPKAGHFPCTLRRLSKAELVALAKRQTRVCTPPQIKTEWREWTMEKRAWFIALMRTHLGPRFACPTGPFSANVEFFDYTTPNVQAFLQRRNVGKSSNVAGCKIKVCAQGLIWGDELWFWTRNRGYVQAVRWTAEQSRRILSRTIWESVNGTLPSDGIIRHADGNVNNLDPANLMLMTRNDLARENQAAFYTRRSRETTGQLLKLQHQTTKGTNDDLTQYILGTGLC
jgi:hypothetical protein